MSTHGEDSDHIGEDEDLADDDTQLVIRIPNPKVYMARQSRWVGRRGKPRCDHCRLTNLKVRQLFSVLREIKRYPLAVRPCFANMQSLLLGKSQGLQIYPASYPGPSRYS